MFCTVQAQSVMEDRPVTETNLTAPIKVFITTKGKTEDYLSTNIMAINTNDILFNPILY